jgi:BirA family biotin operon repressor/biotin-[acetyl-CoA-carboxylase] ligase
LAGDGKIAGLLIESVGHNPRYSIIGIGLNVNQMQFAAPYKATSIRQEFGAEVSTQSVLNQLLECINTRIDALTSGFELLISVDYMNALYGNGRWINVSNGKTEFSALITQVDDSGVIYMKNKAGRVSEHRAKEIKISF